MNLGEGLVEHTEGRGHSHAKQVWGCRWDQLAGWWVAPAGSTGFYTPPRERSFMSLRTAGSSGSSAGGISYCSSAASGTHATACPSKPCGSPSHREQPNTGMSRWKALSK